MTRMKHISIETAASGHYGIAGRPDYAGIIHDNAGNGSFIVYDRRPVAAIMDGGIAGLDEAYEHGDDDDLVAAWDAIEKFLCAHNAYICDCNDFMHAAAAHRQPGDPR